jgi:hypothetical protein
MARVEQELKWTIHPLNLSPIMSANSSRLNEASFERDIQPGSP